MIRGNLIRELTGLSLYSLGIDSFVYSSKSSLCRRLASKFLRDVVF